MIPIYEQGGGRGIGHDQGSFLKRFGAICSEHLAQHRAKGFALIFYDFHDQNIRIILKDQGVFAKLDRLSGNELSIFYLHTASKEAVERFNRELLRRLGLHDARPPCVVFFKLADHGFTDVTVAVLDSTDLIHGFSELYDTITTYMTSNRLA